MRSNEKLTANPLRLKPGGGIGRSSHDNADAALPQKKWGPALLPAPTAPSEGSAGVRNLVDRSFRPIYPLSILAHQLRRRFPSGNSLLRGATLTYSTAPPEGSLVFRPAWPGAPETSDPKTEHLSGPKPPDVLRPFLGQPLLRPASLTEIPRNPGSRVALEKIDSSGASSRLAPLPLPKEPWQCLPAEIGPLVTCRIFFPFPAFR